MANNKQNKSSTRASKRPTATIAFTHKNYLLLALLVFATAVLLAATCFSFSKQNLRVQNWINARRFPIAYLHSNQTAITPAFTATISNIHEDTRKDPAFPLNNNEVLLIMDIAITNNSSTTQTLVPMSQLYMRDNQGNLYKLQPSIYIDDSIPFAKVKPGETIRGSIAYGIPRRIAEPLLYIDLGWDNYVPVVYSPLSQN